MKFYEKIKIATIENIDATATILKLAKHMPNLKVIDLIVYFNNNN